MVYPYFVVTIYDTRDLSVFMFMSEMIVLSQLIADAVISTQLASSPWSHLSQMQAQIFWTVHIHFPCLCILVGKTQLALSTFSRTANKNCHILQVGYLLSGLLSPSESQKAKTFRIARFLSQKLSG